MRSAIYCPERFQFRGVFFNFILTFNSNTVKANMHSKKWTGPANKLLSINFNFVNIVICNMQTIFSEEDSNSKQAWVILILKKLRARHHLDLLSLDSSVLWCLYLDFNLPVVCVQPTQELEYLYDQPACWVSALHGIWYGFKKYYFDKTVEVFLGWWVNSIVPFTVQELLQSKPISKMVISLIRFFVRNVHIFKLLTQAPIRT